MPNSIRQNISTQVRDAFNPILTAIPGLRAQLEGHPAVSLVRPGYFYPPHADPIPAAVVAVFPGVALNGLDATVLTHRFKVPVSLAEASVEEQVDALHAAPPAPAAPESFGVEAGAPAPSTVFASPLESLLSGAAPAVAFQAPREGTYEPMNPPELSLLDEEMDVIIAVSPEAGFSQLKPFLDATTQSLTVAMYQFTAPHIFAAVQAAVTPAGREFELVLHPIPEPPPKNGVKSHDLKEEEEVLEPLSDALQNRFEFAWATLHSARNPTGLWASAYHIKVAVRDGKATWLSSGNWQSSNQPNFDPFADPENVPAGFQRHYNRDYHAIVVNDRLAKIYEDYIKRDHDLCAAGTQESFALPEVFVPLPGEPTEALSFGQPPQYFEPLHIKRRVKVQPLLTPDNYASNIVDLIKSATTSVWFQNQYITFKNTGEDFEEFQELVGALKDQVDAGLEVRIICRDMMKQSSLDVLVAMGFPREIIRFQPACHNKTIIVDGKTVAFGSHNWSNEGVKTNRDASLIFFDPEIAAYLATIYDYDWNRLATAKPTPDRVRVARRGEPTPAGMDRVPLSDVVED